MKQFLILCLFMAAPAVAYRIQGSIDEFKPFVPYETGFIANTQDPAAARRTRVNQGYESSLLQGSSVGKNRLFSCDQMVGPIDEKYYCRGKEYGYCDRRSGTCFCNDGYMGDSCESCVPSYFPYGGLCYPKKLCPNECSNAGVCNYFTGECVCSNHRAGDDCSVSKCSTFHEFCTSCDDNQCLECEQGWSVMSEAQIGSQCEPCYRFDPRCLNCNATTCNSCVDLLLFSIHRSGRRPQDPPLPIDELTRELSITVPFGSTQEDAFYDAEHYFLVDPDHVPLKESAVECHQGLNSDDSIDCIPYNMTSHVMCGNHGTITFTSPEFAVKEDAKQIRLTLQRSGGGVGEVSVSYSIYPITANYQDVTATAHYTSNQTVVFRHGQIRASFLVTINDDRIMEENVTFSVHLHNPSPSGKVRLGTQQRTIVTIIDDDLQQTCSNQTTVSQNQTDLGETYAGIPLQFTVNAASCSGKAQTAGGDIYKAVARKVASAKEMTYGIAPWFIGTFDDNGNGTYRGAVNVTSTGQYELAIFLLIPGGLRGSYYTDAFLSEPSLDLIRTDATVNFTYGTGPITTFAKDYVSVRWEGCVLPFHTEVYTFWLDIDDQARLWIDNELVIDSWAFSSSLSSSMPHVERKLQASVPHDIVLEYRDITGSAKARLLWSSPNTTLSAIPPSNLLYKERVGRYNFTVHASSVDAKESSATGEGIHSGVAGKELSFTIQPNDRFGNFRGWPLYSLPRDTRHMDHFHASATLLDSNFGEVFVPVNVHYNETTRKFLAFYTPITSGIYQLNVTSSESGSIDAEEHILGSPFMVDILPGATFAPLSLAYGSGLHHGMSGVNSTFYIEALDMHSNRRNQGGDDWTVKLSSVDDFSNYQDGIIQDHGNGTYTAHIMPTRSGKNELEVKLNGSHIRGSPFEMIVIANQAVGSASFVHEGTIINAMGEESIAVNLSREHEFNFDLLSHN